jgi:hypothetical protein
MNADRLTDWRLEPALEGTLERSGERTLGCRRSTRSRRHGRPQGEEGDVVLLVPGGVDKVRATLRAAVSDDDWGVAQDGFGDPHLADQ